MNKDLDRDIEQYVSTGVLMDVVSISRSTVCRLIARGMPNIMVGSVHRFPIDQVLKWLKENYGDNETNRRSRENGRAVIALRQVLIVLLGLSLIE